MRITRLLGMVLVVLLAGLLVAPSATAEPPFRLPTQVTDRAGALSGAQQQQVQQALDRLYNDRRIQLWVVYVRSFDGQSWLSWAQNTMAASDFGDDDALLAVAVDDRAFAFQVPSTVSGGTSTRTDAIRRDNIEPALHRDDWAGAAIAAADGLNADTSTGSRGPVSMVPMFVALGVIVAAALVLWLWLRGRRRRRHQAEVAAAKRVDPTDPNALAAVPLEALDELSKTIVVDVDNAVRTSESELALAVEEFGSNRTAPFSAAVADAKTALAQAFNVRQTLDDAVPETPLQRRDLLTRVIVAAAKADRTLDEQGEAFGQLRDLVINAPTRLDALTQQLVSLTARIDPARQTLAGLRGRYADTALASVANNVDAASDRLAFADKNIGIGRTLVSKPATDQTALVDAVRAAEGAMGQAQTLLDAVDSAASDIDHAVGGLPAALADIQNGIDAATAQLQQPGTPQADQLRTARDAAQTAATAARDHGTADPLGTFTRLTMADADLDRILATVDQQRQEAEKQARTLDQALFTAGSRVQSVSDFIDTRRGSIGSEARTRLSEANRQLEAAQAKKGSNPAEAIAHANGAATLAAQAQSLANDDVRRSQQPAYGSQYGGGSDLGSVIGGIIIGNVLRGGFSGRGTGWGGGGYGGSWGGGRSPGRPTTYGGSGNSSGRSYSGGGGRF